MSNITELFFEMGRKREKDKDDDYILKGKIYLVCPRCSKLLSDVESFCSECGSRVLLEIEIKKVIVRRKIKKIRGE